MAHSKARRRSLRASSQGLKTKRPEKEENEVAGEVQEKEERKKKEKKNKSRKAKMPLQLHDWISHVLSDPHILAEAQQDESTARILAALEEPVPNLQTIREEAIHRGFGKRGSFLFKLRPYLWALLLGVDIREELPDPKDECDLSDETPAFKSDYQVVKQDVLRSMWHWDSVALEEGERTVCREHLEALIAAVLQSSDEAYPGKVLRYYQGYHDIVSVILFGCAAADPSLPVDLNVVQAAQSPWVRRFAFPILKHLSFFHLQHCMFDNLDIVVQQLNLLFPLISQIDSDLFRFIQTSTAQPFFSLSLLLTWGSHEITSADNILRLFDALIAAPPIHALYFSAAIVESKKEKLMQLDCSFSDVHKALSHTPEKFKPVVLDTLIKRSFVLSQSHPPDQLLKIANDYPHSRVSLDPDGSLMATECPWIDYTPPSEEWNMSPVQMVVKSLVVSGTAFFLYFLFSHMV